MYNANNGEFNNDTQIRTNFYPQICLKLVSLNDYKQEVWKRKITIDKSDFIYKSTDAIIYKYDIPKKN